MKQFIPIFFWGMFISFLGSLPPGTMNITATNMAVRDGAAPAMIFAFGSMLAEIIIVRIALAGMKWIDRHKNFFRLLEWLTVFLIAALAAGCFIAAVNMTEFGSAIPQNTNRPFLLGIILSAANPLHIPFWMGWSTMLTGKGILQQGNYNYNWYVAGIGLGTMLGFAVFIYGGNYLVEQLNDNQNILNWAIGCILSVTVIIQVYKMFRNPALKPIRNY